MNLRRRIAVFLLAIPVLAVAAPSAPPPARPALPDGLYAEVTTERGVIVAEIYYQKTPMTAASFVGLAEGTLGPQPRKPFYDGLTFHRVVPGFVVQGGDPFGTGNGDAGYAYPDEIVPGLRFDKPGTMLIANSGSDTNGSQWCFMLAAVPRLDYAYTNFGQVISGLDILPLIKQGDHMQVKILRIGKAAQAFRADDAAFNKLVAHAKRLPAPHFDDGDNIATGEQPWYTKNLETKLANLQRFVGAQAYVRLFEKFEPSTPQQTMQQFIDAFRVKYAIPPKATLAAYFSDSDTWILASGSPAGLKLPDYKRRVGPPPAADKADEVKKEKTRVYYSALEVTNSLIYQLEPKK